MNRTLYSTALGILMSGTCLADNLPTLAIHKCDGECTVVLSELLSVKYTESDMMVNMKDGTQLVFPLADILVMELGQQPTAVGGLLPHAAEPYVITDLQGKILSEGKGGPFVWPTQKGVYIISVGDKSKKLILK